MYSKQADVRLGTNKGSLRLQFSSRISQQFYGKKQKYVGLGRHDSEENKKWADGVDGIVSALVKDGKISYLKPYSTRHTFISIQANNGTDLALIADVCGTSVDKIMKHYLQPDKQRELTDI